MHRQSAPPLETWAGLEGTVNRIGDRYMDQCLLNGHDDRHDDLEKIAALGIKRIRYPALWEKVETRRGVYNWDRLDRVMAQFKELGLQPIIGLLHHGSGPAWTSLVDPEFPPQFASYARAFAERYAWVDHYTPINEPLTTARFSCLYGAWYPHHRNDRSFVRATALQMKAITLAMREIRVIQPAALLVQTEDLGHAISTPPLRYQAEFENNRRWLTYDFLFRRVGQNHPLAAYLKKSGLSNGDRDWLFQNASVPDIIGINHYLLSNRYLDHRLENYPSDLHGGNGRHQYVDVGAVHFAKEKNPMIETVLQEVSKRYPQKIIAVTEVHLDGPRESQMRWLADVRHQCEKLKAEGLPIKAVTAWSLLGTYNWNSLCTRDDNYYESGVFDARAENVRPTGLARLVSKFATNKSLHEEPVLARAGWWRAGPSKNQSHGFLSINNQPIVITGGRGALAQSIARLCEARGLNALQLSKEDLDISDFTAVKEMIERLNPWAVINAAGYTRIDAAEDRHESVKCHSINVVGARNLATACEEKNVRLVTFSSNFVFGGERNTPYVESDETAPQSIYGKTHGEAERSVLKINPSALVVRTSALFGPWDETNFLTRHIRQLRRGEPITVYENITFSPTYIPDLVNVVLDLLIDHESGLIHLTNQGAATWAELAKLVVKGVGIDQALIREVSYQPGEDSKNSQAVAPRPLYSVMTSERSLFLPDYQGAIERYFKDLAIAL